MPNMTARSTSIASAALAAVLCLASTTGAFASRQSVGSVEKVQEEAQAIYHSERRMLSVRSDVIQSDRLKTGPRARLQATLRDGTQLTLGEHASIEIDEYVYSPGSEGGKMALEVIEGAFLFVGGEIEAPSGGNVEITTPIGVLAVRGTTVWGGAIDGGYGVLVLDGEVRIATRAGSVTLNGGEGTMIYDLDEAPGAPAPWSEEKIGRAVRTISFE